MWDSIEVHVTGIKMRLTETKLRVGESIQLNPTVQPSNATIKTVEWVSSNEDAAIVWDNGTVVGFADGEAIITGTTVDGGYQVQCKVTVYGGNGIERNAEDMNTSLMLKDGKLYILKRVDGEEQLYAPSGQRIQ